MQKRIFKQRRKKNINYYRKHFHQFLLWSHHPHTKTTIFSSITTVVSTAPSVTTAVKQKSNCIKLRKIALDFIANGNPSVFKRNFKSTLLHLFITCFTFWTAPMRVLRSEVFRPNYLFPIDPFDYSFVPVDLQSFSSIFKN